MKGHFATFRRCILKAWLTILRISGLLWRAMLSHVTELSHCLGREGEAPWGEQGRAKISQEVQSLCSLPDCWPCKGELTACSPCGCRSVTRVLTSCRLSLVPCSTELPGRQPHGTQLFIVISSWILTILHTALHLLDSRSLPPTTPQSLCGWTDSLPALRDSVEPPEQSNSSAFLPSSRN